MPNSEHPVEVNTMSKIRYALFQGNTQVSAQYKHRYLLIDAIVKYHPDKWSAVNGIFSLNRDCEIRQLPEERRTENSTGARGKSDE